MVEQKRNSLIDSATKPPYVPAQPSVASAAPPRSQHAPQAAPFFGAYPTRVPPPTSYNDGRPHQHFSGFIPPRPPFAGSQNDDRENRYDRTNLPPHPAGGPGYQLPPSSSYEYYPQQPPNFPAGAPPPSQQKNPRFELKDGAAPPINSSPGTQFPVSKDHPYSPPPYVPGYPPNPPHSWSKGEKRFTEYPGGGGPYTSAQRSTSDAGKEDVKSVAPKDVKAGPPPAALKKIFPPYPVNHKGGPTAPMVTRKPLKTKAPFDPDALAYRAVEGREGATSPSQIEFNRRDDVAIMGCTCKKSKCLKLYCVCFAASVVCGQNCRCIICHNNLAHDKSRKDAIRCIIARNPSAFDTKFKKSVDPKAVLVAQKSVAHKLGCKCRKSYCTKKYCECYNAGIKCSGSCRCVSCKNMPPGGFGPPPAAAKDGAPVPATRPLGADVVRSKKGEGKKTPNSEHKMMDAAQHLAFLKHASPARPDTANGRIQPSSSIPGLAASSSGASSSPDEDAAKKKAPLTPGGGVNTLLLAAYAMTELGESKAPPKTPEKKINTVPYRSPKRKLLTPVADQFADADSVHPEDHMEIDATEKLPPLGTPKETRNNKRTRVGTVERKPASTSDPPFDKTPRAERHSNDSSEEDEQESPEKEVESSPEEISNSNCANTPKMKTNSGIGIMTPVSARCLDFQHMGVADKSVRDATMDEKKEDTQVTTAA